MEAAYCRQCEFILLFARGGIERLQEMSGSAPVWIAVVRILYICFVSKKAQIAV
jgi:hypothetical protein